jgi:hypothetical protein
VRDVAEPAGELRGALGDQMRPFHVALVVQRLEGSEMLMAATMLLLWS